MNPVRAPVGGRILDRTVVFLLAVVAVALVMVVWRFSAGIGAVSGLSDGYPWGIWIAFDVVTGTALACGGYGVALLVFAFNKRRYHPLVRSAMLTSALGYTIAGLSLIVDTGRPWNFWKVPVSIGSWNIDSALLEVALCIMTYVVVVWIEAAPGILERLAQGRRPGLAAFAAKANRWIDRALPVLLGLGFILPTLHQSSLGSLLVLTGPRLHALWQTALLPVLFLMSCLAMGFAAVVFETMLAHAWFGRKRETKMLAGLSGVIAWLLLAFVAVRLVDAAVRGVLPQAFTLGMPGALFLVENLLCVAGAAWLLPRAGRTDPGHLFRVAMLVMFAGALYRFDTFLVAFQPGSHWSYFPTVPEILITLGFIALEILVYIVLVKRFPYLGGLGSRGSRVGSPS